MIPITPIEGMTILLSVDTIAAIESTPETVVVLVDQRRMVVSDKPETIVRNINRRRAARIARSGRLDITTGSGSSTTHLRAAERTGER